jgi:predicted peptidase
MVSRYARKFAAVVPICGGIHGPPGKPELSVNLAKDPTINDPYAETAARIGRTPVWIFHGDADPLVPVEESRKMAQAQQAAKAKVRYTEYPGVTHNSWDKAYAEPDLVTWLLSQELEP